MSENELTPVLRDALGVIEVLTIVMESGDTSLAARAAYDLAKSSNVEARARAALAAEPGEGPAADGVEALRTLLREARNVANATVESGQLKFGAISMRHELRSLVGRIDAALPPEGHPRAAEGAAAPDVIEKDRRCRVCGNRGFINGACMALECPDPTRAAEVKNEG